MSLRSRIGRTCAWLGIGLLMLATWLLVPELRAHGQDAPPLAVLLVDASASAVAPRPSWPAQVRAVLASFARDAARAGDDVCVIAFGDGARRAFGPAGAQDLADRLRGRGDAFDPARALLAPDRPSGDGCTRLASALELARTLAAARPRARITVCGDGTFTGPDAAPIAFELSRAGVAIERVDLAPPELPNLGLGTLAAPRAIEAGAPLVASCEIGFTPGSRSASGSALDLSLDVVRTDVRGEIRQHVRVAPPRGEAADATGTVRWPVHVDLGPATLGAIRISARVSISGDPADPAARGELVRDAIPEDDESTALVRCGGTLLVGVAGDDGARAAFARATEGWRGDAEGGLELLPLAPHAVAAALAGLDALVTLDAPLDDLESDLLAGFVRQGGGWLDVQGWRSIVPDAPDSGRSRLSALSALAPAGDDRPPRDVVLLVDASGSMSGAPFESVRAALARLVEAVPAQDGLEARFFAAELGPALDLGPPGSRADPAARKSALQRLAAAHEPSGATHLWRALEDLARDREARSREALIVLLSDGRDPERQDLARRGAELRARLGAARARLAVVAVGADADRELLRALLQPDEELREAPDLAGANAARELARLLEREILRGSVREGIALRVLPAGAAGTSRTDSLAAPIVRAQGDPKDWPLVARFVRCRAASGAEIAWTSSAGEPLLALQAVGRGVAAALAFQPGGDWAPAWSGHGALLAPILRALARGALERRATGLELDAIDGEIVLSNVARGFPAEVRARLFDQGGDRGAEREIGVIRLSAGRAGRDPWRERSAPCPSFVSSAPGGLVRASIDAGPAGVFELPIRLPRAEEFSRPPDTFVPPPPAEALSALAPARPRPAPAAPWVLGLALGLLAAAAFLGSFARRRA